MKNKDLQSDETLARSAQLGDNDAVTELLHRYKPTVKTIARRFFLIGGEQDDLVQEGMIAVFNAAKTYNDEKTASFKTFANICVRRQLIDIIRRESRNKNKALNDAVKMEDGLVSEKGNPEETIINDENFLSLCNKISAPLNDDEQEILLLFIDGFSYREIAEKLNISTKKVDNSLQKIKKTLRNDNIF